jgi:hypothetical protein
LRTLSSRACRPAITLLISETLRHLHSDAGNAHRSETSFGKFWNVAPMAAVAA